MQRRKNTPDIILSHLCLVKTILFLKWMSWSDGVLTDLVPVKVKVFWQILLKFRESRECSLATSQYNSSWQLFTQHHVQLRGNLTEAQEALFQFNNEVLHIPSWLVSDHWRVSLGNFPDLVNSTILSLLRSSYSGLGRLPTTPFTLFISLPALNLPPSSLPSISLPHAHQRSQVGAFNGRWCVQSDSGKAQPLPNQSTYLIHLSQGQGPTNNTPDKTGENDEGRQKSRRSSLPLRNFVSMCD